MMFVSPYSIVVVNVKVYVTIICLNDCAIDKNCYLCNIIENQYKNIFII